jgi:hypothetical protein
MDQAVYIFDNFNLCNGTVISHLAWILLPLFLSCGGKALAGQSDIGTQKTSP